VHALDDKPAVAPYKPALQFVHTLMPCTLYWPARHCTGVDDVDPAGHTYPAVQSPEHDDDVSPDTDPYLPALQGPEHVATVRPDVDP